jgi:hypothetical protein
MSTSASESIPVKYRKQLRRRNAIGWEGWNLEGLARDVGVTGQYLRDVLTGKKGASVELVQRVANQLGWEFGAVVERMDRAENFRYGRSGRGERLLKARRLQGFRD